jgi:hypothetical protein
LPDRQAIYKVEEVGAKREALALLLAVPIPTRVVFYSYACSMAGFPSLRSSIASEFGTPYTNTPTLTVKAVAR